VIALLEAIISGILIGGITLSAAYTAVQNAGLNPPPGLTVNQLVTFIRAAIAQLGGGGNNVACANTHTVTSKAQGPGICCAALTASGLTPAVGVRVATVNSKGACIVCEVKASTNKKAAPGTLVFKRGKSHVPGSAVSCPTSVEGCCALSGA
jgi:hypothetical protein